MSSVDVEIWHGNFQQLVPLIDRMSVLSPDERSRGALFARDELRARWLTGRIALRLILARYDDQFHHGNRLPTVSCDATAADRDAALGQFERVAAVLQFTYGPHGKPSLSDGPYFSVSHTAGYLAIAVSRSCPIGLDIEETRHLDDWHDIARLVMTVEEQQRLAALPAGSRSSASKSGSACVLAAWTRKEALLKALGLGVSKHLQDVDMRLDPNCDDALSGMRIAGETAARWRVGSIDIDRRHLVSALALESRVFPTLRFNAITSLLKDQKTIS